MSDVSKPLLVYSRIEANRRRTHQLLALFGTAVLPFASGIAVWLAAPIELIFGLFAIILVPSVGEWIKTAVGGSLGRAILVEAGLFSSALFLASLGFAVVTTALIYRYSSAMVLRSSKACPLTRKDERGLHRTVENLCVGAGLPKPRLYLIESSTPNAFATGHNPQQAALVVTRGLLTLLDRRELEGVIAHELSHVGNQDIRLNTTLAGLVGTLTMPLTAIMAVLRFHPLVAVVAIVIAMPLVSSLLMAGWWALTEMPAMVRASTGQPFPPILWWWALHSLLTPFYMVLVAPLVGRLLKRSVSREREFLADADAVALTRNPEALALALIKVDSARGTSLKVGPATAHIYFADPIRSDESWLPTWFRSHPPIEDRLNFLFRMGSGVAPSAVQRAIRAGVEHIQNGEPSSGIAVPRPGSGRKTQETRSPAVLVFGVLVLTLVWGFPFGVVGMLLFLCVSVTLWFEKQRRAGSADELSVETTPNRAAGRAVANPKATDRPPSPDITDDSLDRCGSGTRMFELPASTPSELESDAGLTLLAEEADLGQRFRLVEQTTEMYLRPDGWSPVVKQLPPGTVITLDSRDSGFLKVTTETGLIGYVGRRTRLVPIADC